MTELRKRLFIDAQWNTGGRVNEILPRTRSDFALDNPLTGSPLASPFVVLRTLKQRKLEEVARSRSRRPAKEEKQAERGAAHRTGVRSALKEMVSDGAAAGRQSSVLHQQREHSARLIKQGGA